MRQAPRIVVFVRFIMAVVVPCVGFPVWDVRSRLVVDRMMEVTLGWQWLRNGTLRGGLLRLEFELLKEWLESFFAGGFDCGWMRLVVRF